MRRKSLILFLLLCMVLVFGNLKTSAIQLSPTTVELTSQSGQVVLLAVEESEKDFTITLEASKLDVSQARLLLWTKEDRSDFEELTFVPNDSGQLQVQIGKVDSSTTIEDFSFQIEIEATDGTHHLFEEDVIRKEIPSTSSASSSMSSSTSSSTSSTSLPSYSSSVSVASASSVHSSTSSLTSSSTSVSSTQTSMSSDTGNLSVSTIGGVKENISTTIKIQNHNLSAGTFDVVVSGLEKLTNVKNVKIPIWTEEGGQDDLVWYAASKQANGTYKVNVSKARHKNGASHYHIHVYYDATNGRTYGIATTKTSFSRKGKLTIQNLNTSKGSFDVVVSEINAPAALQAVKIPIWTEENGQDDLKWYLATKQANGTYKISVNKSNHKNGIGAYQVHLYYQEVGRDHGLTSTTVSLLKKDSGKLTISNVNNTAGTFDVIISNVVASSTIQSVQIPVWTEVNGQDDLKWYKATKQANGTYKVTIDKKNHKNGTGRYHVHLYYQFSNNTVGIATTTANLLSKASGKLRIANINAKTGTFDVLISDVVGSLSIQSILVPVWSEVHGQDDIRWYTAYKQSDGTYKVTVDKKNHKDSTGDYQVHLYYKYTDGSTAGIASTKLNLPQTTLAGTISVQNQNSNLGTFDLIITGLSNPSGIRNVLVPVWSEVQGQDDIQWYTATRQADGSYKVRVEARNHKYSRGVYQAHLYITDNQEKLIGITSTTTTVSISQTRPQATVMIKNINNIYGYFEVEVSNIFAPKGIEKVLVPVWSTVNGQNDIQWYEAIRESDGNYRAYIRVANHQYETGTYNAHAYLVSGGVQSWAGSASPDTVTYTSKTIRTFIDVSSHNGSLSVADYRSMMNQGVSGVVVKLTEGTTYRNPLAATQVRNAQAAGLKVSVYHYSHFTDTASAQAEARYFVAMARELGLSTNTVMVNDIEEHKTRTNINANMKSWEAEMKRLGYSNLVHYTGASWIDNSGLGFSGPIVTSQFGMSNFWIAQYPYAYNTISVDQARAMGLHVKAAAWQFTSVARLLVGRSYFDLNLDYTGRFTN